MTKEEQRVAIAKACGWKAEKENDLDWGYVAKHPSRRFPTYLYSTPEEALLNDAPDFLTDLNACREAWLTLNTVERSRYAEELAWIVLHAANDPKQEFVFSRCSLSLFANATAAQRCEAFLRTKGFWRD